MPANHTGVLIADLPSRQEFRTERTNDFVVKHHHHRRDRAERPHDGGRQVIREQVDERDIRLKPADRRPCLLGRERIDDLEGCLRCAMRGAVRHEVGRATRRRPCTAREQADVVSGGRKGRSDRVSVHLCPSRPRHPVRHKQDAQVRGHQRYSHGHVSPRRFFGGENHGQAPFAVFDGRHWHRLTANPLDECVKRSPIRRLIGGLHEPVRPHGRLANGGERPGRPDPVSRQPRDLQLWQHTMAIHPQRALLPDDSTTVCRPGTKAHVHLCADTPAHREHQRRAVVLLYGLDVIRASTVATSSSRSQRSKST